MPQIMIKNEHEQLRNFLHCSRNSRKIGDFVYFFIKEKSIKTRSLYSGKISLYIRLNLIIETRWKRRC